MDASLQPREIQTRVKHDILSRYIRDWGGIITNGLAASARTAAAKGRPFEVRFIYFDGFSYIGRYSPDPSSPQPFAYGSPVIGVQALDSIIQFAASKRKVPASGIAILNEKVPSYFADLIRTFEALNYGSRLKINPPLSSLRPGDIALTNADAVDISKDVLQMVKQNTFLFGLLDPYGPTGIPYDFVKAVVNTPRTDAMIYLPVYDLIKKAGMVSKESLTPTETALLNNYDRVFGSQEWRGDVEFSLPGEELEVFLVDIYGQTLEKMSENLTVKRIRMKFARAERTMYYLFLTTHNPDGALKMNEVLHNAEIKQEVMKRYAKAERDIALKQTTPMFPLTDYDAQTPLPHQVDISELARQIFADFSGKSISLREIKRSLSDSDVFVNEIAAAIRLLRKQKQATFSLLTNDALINFKSPEKGSTARGR